MYVVVGDGELAEGQIWEALMASVNFHLDNLCVILDRNGLQATGKTDERFCIEPIREKFLAFGLEVFEIDGHDMGQILDALDKADQVSGKPTAIIAHTVKGKGIPFAENAAAFHNGTLTEEQFTTAMKMLEEEGGLE